MVRIVAILGLVMLLWGCGPKNSVIVPGGAITVTKPVAVCHTDMARSFEKPSRPKSLPMQFLKEDASPAAIQQAYFDTVYILIDYIKDLELARSEGRAICKAIQDNNSTLNTGQVHQVQPQETR